MSADQLPTMDERDTDIASETEAAEAMGTSISELRAEVLDEERQRHPDMHDDGEYVVRTTTAADELRERITERNR